MRIDEPRDGELIHGENFNLFAAMSALEVKEVAPEARRRDAIVFAFVYPDKHGRFVVKEVGRMYSYPNGRRPDSGGKALGDLSFQIGDYLDVAIL
ncbi:Histone deacetylase complex subunit SAP18 [Camellia lanceoleosa]|uniref:Histone deacetylase complex subunit SAP18 n=1 Tax=Camellia lanceoleosa TaxID=1840588 RepID=A0ACC0FT46_9ERIC|nr:Histone deacetylase complex subunit SAP18 [Camellia lanceoleosa]